MFAIVDISGNQVVVAEKQEVVIPHMEGKVGDSVTFDHVLLTSDDGKTSVGAPYVSGVKIKAEITKQGKGEKLTVRRYKQKVRYRKTTGFRPLETTLKIVSIG